jgi:hypothetical protein
MIYLIALTLVLVASVVFILIMRNRNTQKQIRWSRPEDVIKMDGRFTDAEPFILDEPRRPMITGLKLSQTQPHLTKRTQHLALTHKQRAQRIRRRRAGEQI